MVQHREGTEKYLGWLFNGHPVNGFPLLSVVPLGTFGFLFSKKLINRPSLMEKQAMGREQKENEVTVPMTSIWTNKAEMKSMELYSFAQQR